MALIANARLSDHFVSFSLRLVVCALLERDAQPAEKECVEKIVIVKDARLVYSLHSFIVEGTWSMDSEYRFSEYRFSE